MTDKNLWLLVAFGALAYLVVCATLPKAEETNNICIQTHLTLNKMESQVVCGTRVAL